MVIVLFLLKATLCPTFLLLQAVEGRKALWGSNKPLQHMGNVVQNCNIARNKSDVLNFVAMSYIKANVCLIYNFSHKVNKV